MFTLLSDQKNVLTHLQTLSATDLRVATTNLTTMISALNVDVTELLANRKKYGVLLGEHSTGLANNESLETKFTTILTCENHLMRAINTLCLTEAILVRDVFSNALEIIIDSEEFDLSSSNDQVTHQVDNNENKQQSQSLPINNVAPIHLNDVKQRLTQALQPQTQQHEHIKNKLNALLAADKSVHAVKKAI